MRNLLMTPGPTSVPEEARLIMAKEMIHHRTKEFSSVMKELSENLKYLFKTENPVITLSSSGTGAMEAAVVNLFSKEEKVLIVNTGNFGKRFVDLAKTYGLNPIELTYKWGESANLEDIKEKLESNSDIKGIFITHHETSTGVVNNIKGLGEYLKGKNILFVVDSISGLTANEFKTDEWGVDCAVSGSQKGFMAPPGIAFAALSKKAIEALKKSDIPKFYFSFEKALKSYDEGQTPFTPALTTILSANEACKMLKKEGIDNIINRHRIMKEATCEGVKALNLEFFIKDENARGNTVTTIVSPKEIESGKIKKLMAEKYGITIAAGQGEYKGKIFRIGHLGAVDALDIVTTFSALELALSELNYEFTPGIGVKAVQEYLIKNLI